MTDTPTGSLTSIGAAFSIPGYGYAPDSHAKWRAFEDRLKSEIKSVKTASTADLAPKIAELFDIQIPEILLGSWTKAAEVRAIMNKSKAEPGDTFWAGLGEHTVTSEHHPYVDIRIKGQTVKRIEFTIRLSFKLDSFVLKIQQGVIREIQTGTCELQGVVEYQGVAIAEKKLEAIHLPGVIVL